jgi:hypothetical protein
MASKREPLSVTHPELAAQADGWDPTTVTAGTAKKLKWKCPKEHSWTTGIINRATKGTGCPSCSGRLAIPGETDLATTHPELAAQAAEWDPTTVKAGTNRKLKWRCDSEFYMATNVGIIRRASEEGVNEKI